MRAELLHSSLLIGMAVGLLVAACAAREPAVHHKKPEARAARSIDDLRSRPDQNAPGSQVLEGIGR